MRLSRRSQIDPFIVMDVMEAAAKAEAAGRRIIHMEVGQPGTPAPEGARAAVTKAIADGPLGYTCLLYTSPSPRDLSTSRMPSSA